MSRALIGHTGFVGGNLARQTSFDAFFNSKNIEDIAGQSFDTIVCSGVSAVKWLANQQPEEDRRGIQRLMSCLERVKARQLVLISTVDVFRSSIGADEHTPVTLDNLCAYGRHRYELEEFVRQRFPALVIRLPGLFGQGLKKNIIYDFMHGNNTDRIHHAAVFQFYDLAWLWPDIELAQSAALNLVHFATEPVSVQEISVEVFDSQFSNEPPGIPPRYDLRTCHAALFGGTGGYLRGRGEVLDRMRAFVRREAPLVCR